VFCQTWKDLDVETFELLTAEKTLPEVYFRFALQLLVEESKYEKYKNHSAVPSALLQRCLHSLSLTRDGKSPWADLQTDVDWDSLRNLSPNVLVELMANLFAENRRNYETRLKRNEQG
jgi:hypothetical protein